MLSGLVVLFIVQALCEPALAQLVPGSDTERRVLKYASSNNQADPKCHYSCLSCMELFSKLGNQLLVHPFTYCRGCASPTRIELTVGNEQMCVCPSGFQDNGKVECEEADHSYTIMLVIYLVSALIFSGFLIFQYTTQKMLPMQQRFLEQIQNLGLLIYLNAYFSSRIEQNVQIWYAYNITSYIPNLVLLLFPDTFATKKFNLGTAAQRGSYT